MVRWYVEGVYELPTPKPSTHPFSHRVLVSVAALWQSEDSSVDAKAQASTDGTRPGHRRSAEQEKASKDQNDQVQAERIAHACLSAFAVALSEPSEAKRWPVGPPNEERLHAMLMTAATVLDTLRTGSTTGDGVNVVSLLQWAEGVTELWAEALQAYESEFPFHEVTDMYIT